MISALSDATVSHIMIAAGHYGLSAELSVTRSVTIEAVVAGTLALTGPIAACRILVVAAGLAHAARGAAMLEHVVDIVGALSGVGPAQAHRLAVAACVWARGARVRAHRLDPVLAFALAGRRPSGAALVAVVTVAPRVDGGQREEEKRQVRHERR